MWDDIQIQCSSAFEIAEALINGDVTLSQLRAVAAFAPKADIVEDAVFEKCCNTKMYNRYLDIYPNGRHQAEIEEFFWRSALESNDMNGYISYRDKFPQGVHVAEVDDKVWEVAVANSAWNAYLNFFPNGIHVGEAKSFIDAQKQEEEVWLNAVSINTPESYQNYIDAYPNGTHLSEANQCISQLMAGRKASIIDVIKKDNNAYPLTYIRDVLKITREDLRGIVDDDVLKSWDKRPKNLTMGVTPKEIPTGSTEVYFWGIPGSGKTCAMAAILSRARQMGCFAPRVGSGLAYMNELSTMFISERERPAVFLPAGSDVDTTQYLPLTLNEKIQEKSGKTTIKPHNLSVIEISGEIFECFSCEIEGIPFKTRGHQSTYEQLKQYLKNEDNPKYHFFILDSKPLRDSDQMRYLQNAALYFQENKIFNRTTQGISLIVTKSDVLSTNRNEWVQCAKDAAVNYFDSLVTQLKLICGDPKQGGLGLNNGSLDVIPLSIGKVYLQQLCLFDPQPATVLVNKLMEYSLVAETDDWKKKTKKFLKK